MRFEYNLGRVTKLGLIQSGQVSTGEGDSLVEDQGIYQGGQLRIFPLHQERFPLTDQLSLGRGWSKAPGRPRRSDQASDPLTHQKQSKFPHTTCELISNLPWRRSGQLSAFVRAPWLVKRKGPIP